MRTQASGMSAKEAKRFQVEIRRGLERTAKAAHRAKLKQIGDTVVAQQAACKARLKAARLAATTAERRHLFATRAEAKARRERMHETHATEYAKLRAELTAAMTETRLEAERHRLAVVEHEREQCQIANAALEAAKAQEAAHQAEMAQIDAQIKAREKAAGGASNLVRRHESLGEVEGNLPPELIPYFRSIKSRLKRSDRISLTEQVLHAAQEDPAGVAEAQARFAEAALNRELREQRKAEHAQRHAPGTYAPGF